MSSPCTCPRCGRLLRSPSPGDYGDPAAATSAWSCSEHGDVTPVHPPQAPTTDLLTRVGENAHVPLWLPHPMPAGWVVSGVAWAGDELSGALATVLAVSGPHPIPEAAEGDPSADLVLVAEQPGIGLGAHLAGLSSVDAGPALKQKVEHERAEAHVPVDGHDVPLWSVAIPDGIGYVGEAAGVWLWLLAWPATTTAVLLDGFALTDARDPELLFDLRMGPLSPRLR